MEKVILTTPLWWDTANVLTTFLVGHGYSYGVSDYLANFNGLNMYLVQGVIF